jgi:hypothetical protein
MTRPDTDPCAICGRPWRRCECGTLNETKAYLRELADKLMNVPASYGVDQGDVDHLIAIANGDDWR